MIKQALAIGLGFVLSAPAFADKADRIKDDVKATSKNASDGMKDASDTAQDKLGTDSGTHKAKRHAKRAGRKARQEVTALLRREHRTRTAALDQNPARNRRRELLAVRAIRAALSLDRIAEVAAFHEHRRVERPAQHREIRGMDPA